VEANSGSIARPGSDRRDHWEGDGKLRPQRPTWGV